MYKLEDIIEDLKTEKPEVSVWEVIECLEQAQDTISDLQAKVEELTAALDTLVSLKAHKDIHGKDKHYLHNQPAVWEQAKAALKQEGE